MSGPRPKETPSAPVDADAATDAAHRAVEAVWRIESARLIASLVRVVRDVGLAEELAQESLAAALEQWPRDGVPHNPGGWLTAIAKRRAIDIWRRQAKLDEINAGIAHELANEETRVSGVTDAAGDASAMLGGIATGVVPSPAHLDLDDPFRVDPSGDDMLRLIFVACHPALGREARVALTLRLLGGLSSEEIARAFLVPVSTVQQRIVRAKKTLAADAVAYEVPERQDFGPRLASVLEVIYLVFNEGYSATAGDDWMRPALCQEALRLGRVLARLVPESAETHGLVALMEIQASRFGARVDAAGEPILLLDQNRTRWNRLLITRGLSALAEAERLSTDAVGARSSDRAASSTDAAGRRIRGRYTMQAAIAACHARAGRPEDTDWERIAGLYEELARTASSPVVELNRGVAIGMARGAAAGLAVIDRLEADGSLSKYHLMPSVRGDLLAKLGRREEAAAEFERAAALTGNERERRMLLNRAREQRR